MDSKTAENNGSNRVIPRIVEDEMKQSYLAYSMSVIVGRALPDVRDGLKPVHRRVLYAMYDLGMLHNKPFKKSARIVGEVLGKYHPHGDVAVYDSLVRMAQDFSLRYPLINGQGNFGSIDGDNAAAMRYCVTSDTNIVTEKGLIPIGELSKDENINIKVLSQDRKINNTSKWFDSGEHPTLKLTTNKGYTLQGSLNHLVLTLSSDECEKPIFIWKRFDQLKINDYVVLDRSESLWPNSNINLEEYYPEIENNRTKKRKLPKYLNEDLGFILGALVSEGFIGGKKIEFCNSDELFVNKFEKRWNKIFPDSKLHKFRREPSSYGKKHYFRLECHCIYTVKFFHKLGLLPVKSAKKEIPKVILYSKKTVMSEFLKSYFEGDGSISYSKKMIELSCCSVSNKLIKELQIILLRLGIDTFRRFDKYRLTHKLYIRGARNTLKFYRQIGFISEFKNKKLEYVIINYKKDSSLYDYVPFISDFIRKQTSYSTFSMKHNFDRYSNMKNNYQILCQEVKNKTGQDYTSLFEYLLTYDYLFEKVISIEEAGVQRVFSIRVDSKCHSFIGNGFINHNTEAKLNKLAEEMIQDIDKETVDFVPNFDGSLKEPKVLPSKIPNLLINGSSGIAVGMATNIPPHNLKEVCDGVISMIDNPQINVEQLMQKIPGPDFPTGGIICSSSGLLDAYNSGKGKIVVRGKAILEESKGRQKIIINEIPYQVNKTLLIEQIADFVKEKKLQGISDLRDESDRDGMRIVIELKTGTNSDVVLNQLYNFTRLQETFGIIMLGLVNDEPKVLGLKNLINEFIEHRRVIVRKRTQYDLKQAEDRAHILEGIIIALNNIDPVIKLIKASKSADDARTSLIQDYSLSEKQAQAILDIKLQRLTSLEQAKVRQEQLDLLKLIEELRSILASEPKILQIIKNELLEIKEKYGDNRKTLIASTDAKRIEQEELIKPEECVITISHAGYVKRLPLDTYKQQKRGGRGVIGVETKEEDFIEDLFVANTLDYILFFTNKGKVHWLKVYQIQEAGRYAKGSAIVNLLALDKDEKVTAHIPIKEFKPDLYLFMTTKKGIVKKTSLEEFSNPRKGGILAINLENDELISVELTNGTKEIIIATANGLAVRFHENDVRSMGRTAYGVRGIKLRDEDYVVGATIADNTKTLLTITASGYGKRTEMNDYNVINRGGVGVINIKITDKNSNVVAVNPVTNKDEIILITKNGVVIRIPAKSINVIGRNTQGVRIIKLEKEDSLVSAEIVKEDSENEGNSTNQ